jgi:hypothetical protein
MTDTPTADFSAETPILTIRDKNAKRGVAGLDDDGKLSLDVLPDELQFAIVHSLKHTFETHSYE